MISRGQCAVDVTTFGKQRFSALLSDILNLSIKVHVVRGLRRGNEIGRASVKAWVFPCVYNPQKKGH